MARMLQQYLWNYSGKPRDFGHAGDCRDRFYLYLGMLRKGHCRTEQVRNMLERHGGSLYCDGVGIGRIDSLGSGLGVLLDS